MELTQSCLLIIPICICICAGLFNVRITDAQNLALNRTASHLGSYNNDNDLYGAWRAVDGNVDTYSLADANVTSDPRRPPWWRVELESLALIHSVTILVAQSNEAYRYLAPFFITVEGDGITKSCAIVSTEKSIEPGTILNVNCTNSIVGNKVLITRRADYAFNLLALAEVSVQGFVIAGSSSTAAATTPTATATVTQATTSIKIQSTPSGLNSKATASINTSLTTTATTKMPGETNTAGNMVSSPDSPVDTSSSTAQKSSPSQPTVTFSITTSENKSIRTDNVSSDSATTIVIVGIVIGVLGCIVLVVGGCILLYFCVRKRQRKLAPEPQRNIHVAMTSNELNGSVETNDLNSPRHMYLKPSPRPGSEHAYIVLVGGTIQDVQHGGHVTPVTAQQYLNIGRNDNNYYAW